MVLRKVSLHPSGATLLTMARHPAQRLLILRRKKDIAVPLYEYVCRKCSRQFEELVYGNAKPICPSCQSADLERVLSVVAVGKGRPDAPPSPCGSCSNRGGCGFN
jgi:putative FmdB family regulatory protein